MIPTTDGDKKNQANFTDDMKTIGRDILRSVNTKLPQHQRFEFLNHENGFGLKRIDPISLRYIDLIEVIVSYNPDRKKYTPSIYDSQEPSRYRINCSFMISH